MTFRVFLHPKAAQFLAKIDPPLRNRIIAILRELKDSPEKKGERLKPTSFWRVRIGDYRAIYEINREEHRVLVLFIGHRRNVYDEFSKLL